MSEITLSGNKEHTGRLTTRSVVDIDVFNKEIARLDNQLTDNFLVNTRLCYQLSCSVEDLQHKISTCELEIKNLRIHNKWMKLLNISFDIIVFIILLSRM